MFGINDYEKRVFKHNFLRNIIFKVYFKENVSCSSKRADFIETFKEDFPIISDGIAQKIAFTLGGQNGEGQSVSIKDDSNAHQVIMRSKETQKEITLNNELLQYKETGLTYSSSHDFNSKIYKGVDFLQKNGTVECKAFSLRKINIVDFVSNNIENKEVSTYDPLRELVAPYLLCMYEDFKSSNKFIKQNIYTIQFEEKDYSLTIKYGYIISEKNISNSNIKGQIVIDLSIEKKGSFSIDTLSDELQKSHQELYNAFRWCISSRMFNMINGEENSL